MKKIFNKTILPFLVVWATFSFIYNGMLPVKADYSIQKVLHLMKPNKDSTIWIWQGKVLDVTVFGPIVDVNGDCIGDFTARPNPNVWCNAGETIEGKLNLTSMFDHENRVTRKLH
jgi:hypothetical protein